MIVTDPVQQSLKIDSTPNRISDSKQEKPISDSSKAAEIEGMQRKSIFADHAGVLIAQVTDHKGEVIITCPSPEVIKKYHQRLNEGS